MKDLDLYLNVFVGLTILTGTFVAAWFVFGFLFFVLQAVLS